MRRKSVWLSAALAVMITASVATTLVLLTQHVPAFYIRAAVPPGKQRKDISGKFFRQYSDLINSITSPSTPTWNGRLSEEEVNSFFEEDFLSSFVAEKLLPEGVTEPRVAFDENRIRLGFRYGSPPWSTTISLDFRVWLAKSEPNVLVLQLKGVNAGSLPISGQSLLENISEALRRQNIQVTWYRHQGYPTAALKFQADQARPTCQLLQFDLKPGMLTIMGNANETQ
jgi:hypothetical protein